MGDNSIDITNRQNMMAAQMASSKEIMLDAIPAGGLVVGGAAAVFFALRDRSLRLPDGIFGPALSSRLVLGVMSINQL